MWGEVAEPRKRRAPQARPCARSARPPLASPQPHISAPRGTAGRSDSSKLRLQRPADRRAYYSTLFEECLPEKRLPKGTPVEGVAAAVSSEYLRGMCWALAYYLDDCPSWSWLFPYHFAPLAQDMAAAMARLEGGERPELLAQVSSFEAGAPTSAISQLLCVLPRSSAAAVPDAAARGGDAARSRAAPLQRPYAWRRPHLVCSRSRPAAPDRAACARDPPASPPSWLLPTPHPRPAG